MRLHVMAGLLLAVSCSGTHEPTQLTATPPRAAITPTANVPALLGASIDSLRRRLGAAPPLPASFADPLNVAVAANSTARADSQATFRTGGLTLVANYNARTRQVSDLLLLGQHEDSLMGRASLQTSSHDYLVLPVFRQDKPTHLLGLRIVKTR
ncbi:MAG: hypothetical protein WKG07_36990 [Hymenobacter sp.]